MTYLYVFLFVVSLYVVTCTGITRKGVRVVIFSQYVAQSGSVRINQVY